DRVFVYPVTTAGSTGGIPDPHIGAAKTVTVDSYSLPSSAPELGSSNLLDTLDGRLEAAVAATDPAHGSVTALWTAHAVAGGGGSEERWYEIDPNAGTLLQHGSASHPNLYVWNGPISPDRPAGVLGERLG